MVIHWDSGIQEMVPQGPKEIQLGNKKMVPQGPKATLVELVHGPAVVPPLFRGPLPGVTR